ncbi:hypothetical protein ACFL6I_06285 [candidate division KSB1 bacterium]
MEKKDKMEDRSTWAIGGGVMMGIGVGFFFLHANALAFVGSIMAGLGLGLIITSIISHKKAD